MGSDSITETQAKIAQGDLEAHVRQRLRALMAAHSIAQKDVCAASGLGQSQVSQLLSGRRALKVAHLEGFAAAFRMTPRDFLATVAGPPPRTPVAGIGSALAALASEPDSLERMIVYLRGVLDAKRGTVDPGKVTDPG